MAASVDYGMSEGISFREDPDTGAFSYSVMAHVKDLDPVGGMSPFGSVGEEMALIAQALALLPSRGTAGPVAGTVLLSREPEPWPPCDCMVKLNFGSPRPGTGTTRLRVGTTLQEVTSEFDAANRALAFASRLPISVKFNPASPGAPGSAPPAQQQGGQLPWLAPRSTFSYSTLLTYDPAALSRAYGGRWNAATWKGMAAGTVLCMGIEGESSDGEVTFQTDFNFAYDDQDKWMQYLRYIDPLDGKPPVLTTAQVAASNGISAFDMQGSADFDALPV